MEKKGRLCTDRLCKKWEPRINKPLLNISQGKQKQESHEGLMSDEITPKSTSCITCYLSESNTSPNIMTIQSTNI